MSEFDQFDDGFDDDDDYSVPPDIFGDSFGDETFWQEPDFLLNDLITLLVHRAGVELGVTLFVKGLVMSGTLVSEQTYLESLSEAFMSKVRSAVPDMPDDAIDRLQEALDFTDLASEDLIDEELDSYGVVPLRYLHLKEPVIISSSNALGFVDSDVPILRLRMNMVDGWLLGRAIQGNQNEKNQTTGGKNPLLH